MKIKHASTFTLFLVVALFVGCKQNPVDRLLGNDKDSSTNNEIQPNPDPVLAPYPNPSDGITIYLIGENNYQMGTPITFGLQNHTGHTITLRNTAPWAILTETGEVVFAPVAAQVLVPICTGEEQRWTWDQKVHDGSNLPMGTYVLEFYVDSSSPSCNGEIKTYRITFHVKCGSGQVRYQVYGPSIETDPSNPDYEVRADNVETMGTLDVENNLVVGASINLTFKDYATALSGPSPYYESKIESTLQVRIDNAHMLDVGDEDLVPQGLSSTRNYVRMRGIRTFSDGNQATVVEDHAAIYIFGTQAIIAFRDRNDKMLNQREVMYVLKMNLQQ